MILHRLKTKASKLLHATKARKPSGECIHNCTDSESSPRSFLSERYLHGNGIEIGALHQPLKVSPRAHVRYVDRMSKATLLEHYPELRRHNVIDPDVVDNGEMLDKFADSSLDFIIANHFLEHCEDPIRTISNFYKKLKNGGTLYMAIPDKRYTFDRERKITTLEHLIADNQDGGQNSRSEHYFDFIKWAHFKGLSNEAKIQKKAQEAMSTDYSIHFHVWTSLQILELITYINQERGLPLELIAATQFNDEFITILRKTTTN